MMMRFISAAACCAMGLALPVVFPLVFPGGTTMAYAAMASQFASYRATYELELYKVQGGTALNDVSGRAVFSLERHCDGWQSVEDYAISFSAEHGVSKFISHYEAWESLSGDAFSFNAVENSNIEGAAEHNGFANITGGQGEAYFLNGDEAAIPLPADTRFPVNHMHKVLESANEGQKFHGGMVFHGGRQENALVYISVLIGKLRTDTQDDRLGALGMDAYRHIHMAYYKPEAMEPEPDYEIEFILQHNGVIRQYIVDYGDYAYRARLTEITALDAPSC